MAGSGYHKIGDKMAVHSLNQIFGRKLDLNCKSVSGPRSAQSNEMDDYSMEEVYYIHKTSASPGHNNNKKSRKAEEIDRVISEIIPGYKVLILLRGLPGSGKSTLAKSILERTIGYNPETVQKHILSADDFFVRNGVYNYEQQKISEAHSWNHQRAFNVISKGYSPVIIDNTNTQMWEMKAYASMATDFGYILEILEPDTHWCYNERELEKRNTHGVPKLTIQNMLDRYEKNVTPLKLLTAYGFQYKLQKPPQYRLQPPIEPPGTMNSVQFAPSSNSKLNKNKAAFVEITDSFKPQPSLSVLNKPTPSTSVDDILMRTDDSSMLKAPVLTPMNQTAKIKQSTSLFDNINAWGIDEKALRSWNLVTPIELDEMEQISSPIIIDDTDDDVIEIQEMSTSTDNEDFYVLRNLPAISGQLPAYTILPAYNRDINKDTPVKNQRSIPKKTMIHKSCLTVDYLDDHQIHLDNLSGVFPNMTPRIIKYWYEKCNRDFDCTMELLLNENDEFINIIIEENESPVAPVKPTIPEESDGDSSDSSAPPPTPHPKNKRKNNGSSSDEYQDLKKHIESKITISNDHYSEHLLKIKQCKYGPSTPKEPISVDQPDNDSDEKNDSDELEWEFVTSTPSCSKNLVEPVEPVDTIEMNIGDQFVKQLEDRFGDPNLTYPKGFQPVIQIPETLARQLYTFYIESVYQQMDAQNAVMEDLVKEDKDFAKKLQESEEKVEEVANSNNKTQISDQTPTEIPDIMKEQRELSKRQKEADKWKEDTPDTLAARLTRAKLFKAFPSVDKDTLVEILHAHNNIYKDTVDTLLASTTKSHVEDDIESIRNPPLNEDVVQELWDAHNSCKGVIEAQSGEPRKAADYRQEANLHLEKRTKLYEKSQEYFQRGMREVAQYYCGLAAKQTRRYEQLNSLAATAFLDEHSKRLEDFNTLDLHFLYVKEAIPHLDMFLDRNINLLRGSSTKSVQYLHIITGRGKNSSNGIAKIRPAVISRLKERKISYNHQNPGLLKIKISKYLKLTNEL